MARDIERVRLRFYERARINEVPVVLRNSRTSRVLVSSAEATVFDLAERPKDSGSLDNVATIYGGLVEEAVLREELVFRGGACLHQLVMDRPRRYSED